MQNYDIESDDEVRFSCYLHRLLERQLKKGIDYNEIRDVYQLILYTGTPIENFEHYRHVLKRGDFEYGVILQHQKAHAELIQLKRMEEDVDMSVELTTVNQLAYLFMMFMNGKSHEKSREAEEVKEAKEIHNQYMNTDEIIKGYELERERIMLQTKINKAKKAGHIEERYKNVLELIKSIYQIEAEEWLKQCSEEQLKRAFHLVGQQLSYEEFKDRMLK